MIDTEVFSHEWDLLCARFNRKPSKELMARYYDILSPQMSTGEFRAAAVAVLNGAEFFPRPLDFMLAIRPDPAVEALDQWELCERAMQGERGITERMTDEGRRVLGLLGGAVQLGMTPLDKVPFVRKEFLAMYRELRASGHEAIAGPEVTPESRRIVGEAMRDKADA